MNDAAHSISKLVTKSVRRLSHISSNRKQTPDLQGLNRSQQYLNPTLTDVCFLRLAA